MSTEVKGKGRKRPQLNIPVEFLNLDAENPRLAKDPTGVTQLDLLNTLYNDFDIEELGYSMAQNGYFDEEPVVVVPSKVPKGYKLPANVEDQQVYLQKLVDDGLLQFTVVEGNRRTATLKILTNATIRSKVKVSDDFPKATPGALKDLQVIPGICYTNRLEVAPYLGVRHIAGSKKWDFYPRVYYISKRIEEVLEEKGTYPLAFEDVQKQVALRNSSTVVRYYLYYRIAQIIESDLDFDTDPLIKNFSLVEVAVRSPGIRQFIGLGDDSNFQNKIDFKKRVLPSKFNDQLEKVFTWIYGNKRKGILPLFTDSRNIPSLGKVLLNKEASDYLIRTNDFDGAYERSDGEKDMLQKKINDARKKLEGAMQIAYKYKSKDFIALVDAVIEAAEALKKMLAK